MFFNNSSSNDLQPRAPRKRKRNSSERGLASDADLASLARTYLEVQHRLWSAFVKKGVLPARAEDVIQQMVAHYKECHQSQRLDVTTAMDRSNGFQLKLAAAYARYSCDNSSPTSIVDQMVNCLHKAHAEERFIPWEFIFTDYSVSGLDSGRRGYLNCKALIDEQDRPIDTVYIDDFSRASRDSLEWWKLGWFCKRRCLRMIGASDGFDLSSPNWDIFITIYGLLSRLFIRGLQEKVGRGMKGAARRRTCVGKPPMGFTRKVVRDADGVPIVHPSGIPLFTWAIDPVSRQFVELLFELFVDRRMSAYAIAKQFNQQKLDGTDGWTESTIKNMLWNPAYIGVFVWNRTRREFDFDKEKYVTIQNPRSEWIVTYDPTMAIIKPLAKWCAARKLLAQTKRKPGSRQPVSRNQQRATTLFSGTLVCADCGRELLLYRSAQQYKNMYCVNGRSGVYGCKLCTSKSTRVIEGCLLSFLRDTVLTEQSIDELVARANEHLTSLASRPKVNVTPLRSRIASLQKKIDSFVQRVENLKESEEGLREGYERRIIQQQEEVDELKKQLREAEQANAPVPRKLSKKTLRSYLPELRAILNQEIPVAAEAIRRLTGPIAIRQEAIPGKKRGARWIASFSPDLLALLRHATQEKDCPDSVTLEYLCGGNWITPDTVSVPVESVPKYEQLAPKFKELREAGKSVQEIAFRHKVAWQVAWEILQFAETGERPTWRLPESSPQYEGWQHFETLAPLIANLRDEKGMEWQKVLTNVARQTGHRISIATAIRAYEHSRRYEFRVESGISTELRPRSGQGKLAEFRRLFDSGITNGAELARRVGVSRNTANRWKKRPTR
jgi:DNA invertase Pin-like site-specific DNA recombinase